MQKKKGQNMDISRAFLVVGSLFLVVGISMGMYMGGSGDHTLVPVHAHINLLGFTLMSVFGLIYRAHPAMAASTLARAHFWLHLIGGLVLLVMLFLFLSGRIGEESMFPLAPIAEVLVLVGLLTFLYNLVQNGK
jgi:hypothetical protein